MRFVRRTSAFTEWVILFPDVLMAAAAAAAPASAPICGVSDRPVAMSFEELPPSIRKALAQRVADRGQPFTISDVIPAGQERRPFMRLICGYSTPDGYVVEREQGGRGYNIGKIFFNKAAFGYKEQR